MGQMRCHAIVRRIGLQSVKENSTAPSRTYSHKINSCSSWLAAQARLAGGLCERYPSLLYFSHTQRAFIARSFSAATDVQQAPTELRDVAPTELSAETEGGEPDSPHDVATSPLDAKPKKVKKEKLPAEVAICQFFERMKLVEQLVTILKQSSWGEETEKGLEELSLTYSTKLVTQVLRVPFSCDVALGFFNWLKKQNDFKHNEYTYGVLLNSLGRAKHLTEMRDVLNEMKSDGCKITPVIMGCVIHWYAIVGDIRNVRRHWQGFKRAETKPSLGVYTAYLDFLVRVKWFTKIPYVYENMLSEECLPNSRTYTLLIQHLAADGRLRAAVQILEIMQKVQVVPSRLAYEYIIEGYAKAGEVEKVQEFLTAMRERFHRPSKRLMHAVKVLQEAEKSEDAGILREEIGLEDFSRVEHEALQEGEGGANDSSALSEEGDSMLESVMCAWRDVTSPNVGFDVNSFAQAIHTWSLAVEAELEKADVQWGSTLVLEVLRRLRNLETSWPFFHWVKNRAGFKHDKYTCMVMIQRILKSRSALDKTEALVDELFEGMQRDGIKFTVPMFNMMIRHYVLASDIERAQNFFDRIGDYNLEPNAASYAPVIQALAKDRQGRKAMDMLNRMQTAGFHPDSATCAELITCLELAEKLPDAYELFSKIPESGRDPGPLEYKAVMAAASRAGDQRLALSLYERMRGAGVKPTQDMFDEVSVILRKANRQYDFNTIANFRRTLKFFDGRKKALQENLLKVLDLFMRSMKPRPNNAYASLKKRSAFLEDTLVSDSVNNEEGAASSVVTDLDALSEEAADSDSINIEEGTASSVVADAEHSPTDANAQVLRFAL
ncbi:hypothetical protein L7F22_002243 [Adiantum nelumboides]|nr:hypothetical protein [Adiantum nelumboides]